MLVNGYGTPTNDYAGTTGAVYAQYNCVMSHIRQSSIISGVTWTFLC